MSIEGNAFLDDVTAEAGAGAGAGVVAEPRLDPTGRYRLAYGLIALAMLGAGVVAGRTVARWRTPAAAPGAGADPSGEAAVAGLVEGGAARAPAAPVPDAGGLSVGLVEPGMASLGEIAPAFSLAGPAAGTTVALADHAGTPVLLNFWATWCVPCRHEMPFFQALHDAHAAAGDLAVVAIDVDETAAQVAAYLGELGLTFPVGLDEDGAVANQYRIGMYPTTYLIGADGRVMSIKQGAYANAFELEQAAALLVRP